MKYIYFLITLTSFYGSIYSQALTAIKSEISFEIDTRFGLVKGEFKSSNIQNIDIQNKKAKVEVDVSSIDTGNGMRDKHLRDDDFFDVKNHPKATFEVLSIKETAPNSLILSGKLTIKKIERTYEIPILISESNDSIQYTGVVNVNRKDFQINYNSMINPINDIAKVKFSAVLDKKR